MSNSPGQVPTPQSTLQPNQPAPQGVSDKTIDAFMSAPQDKQREALGKMSEPTKQALLQGIKIRKGLGQPQTPAQPTKPEGAISKFFGAGPAIPAKPLTDTEKANPFTSGIASGSMMDPSKLSPTRTTGEFAKEYASQVGSGMKQFGESILKDPLNVGNAIDSIAATQAQAYRKVRDGLKNGDHDLLMNGLGEAVGDLSLLLGGAKSAKEGLGVQSLASSTKFAAKDLTAKRAIVSASSHAALDDLRKNIIDNPVRDASGKLVDKSLVGTAIDAERARIKGNVDSLNLKDKAASPNGYVPTQLWKNVIDQAISDKNATELEKGKALPATTGVKKLMNSYGPNLTFDNLKDIRSLIGSLKDSAVGKDRAILGDLYNSASTNLKGRAAQLGGLSEWEDYNNATEKLARHQSGLISELKGSKTGLDFAKDISSEKNQGRLKDLAKDLHLPEDTFKNALKGHKAIINFAKMTEGDSIVAKTANRLIALKQHPIAASLGGGAGVVAGRAIGTAIGSPMAGSFIGLTLGAASAHELMAKFDAARAIREIGGPSGVMGVRSHTPPSSSISGASGARPSTGPGGGGSSIPPMQPSGTIPPGSPPSGLSPALAKLLPEVKEPEVKEPVAKAAAQYKGPERRTSIRDITGPDPMRQANMNRLRSIMNDKSVDIRDRAIAESQLNDLKAHPYEVMDIKGIKESKVQPPKMTREEAEAASAKRTEGRTARFSSEARGREPSARSGMTKDTPEARRAKAAERVAAKRIEASRTQIKGSLEDQARQVAGKMDFQGKSNIELEEGLQTLYGENGKRFLKEFRNVAKQMKWSDDVYRGYLEDTIDRRAKELAQRSAVPGFETKPKD